MFNPSFLVPAFTNELHGNVKDAVFGQDLLPDSLCLNFQTLFKHQIALSGCLDVEGMLQVGERIHFATMSWEGLVGFDV